ncbi:MAG: DUF1810 family protein, partial [Acetobacteraceae bacterium]|nr:DUF1810 family protein [Acetobacteraceae bacterium]
LILCTETVLATAGKSLHDIFGSLDDMKFRSCMTLFACASDDPENVFRRAVDAFCGSRMDDSTLALLQTGPPGGTAHRSPGRQ